MLWNFMMVLREAKGTKKRRQRFDDQVTEREQQGMLGISVGRGIRAAVLRLLYWLG